MPREHQPNAADKVMDNVLAVAAAATLKSYQTLVIINVADDFTITMPPVGQSKGKTFDLIATALTSQKTATVTATDVNSNMWSDFALDEQWDRISLRSNGYYWVTVESNLS